MDVLADLLGRAHARGAIFARSTLRAPWGLSFADDTPLSFHAVLEGELYLTLDDGSPPARLLQGDLALVCHDGRYAFTHAPGAPAPLHIDASQPPPGPDGTLELDGTGPVTRVLCGAYRFDGSVCSTLLQALPPLVVVRSSEGDAALRGALGLLVDELGRTDPGQQTVLDRLLDLLLVYTLRTWFGRDEATTPRWYAALGDSAVGPVLRAMHERPAHPWTVQELAELAGLSRAAFAKRFSAQTGETPLGYLTAWRMTLAADALLKGDRSIAQIAQEVGYANEFAFGAAFKRQLGLPPGRWRAERRAERAAAA